MKPNYPSVLQAWCDASFNFGLTIGPVIGAFMYGAPTLPCTALHCTALQLDLHCTALIELYFSALQGTPLAVSFSALHRYDAGGFFLPFAVTGTAILLSGVVVLVVTDVSRWSSYRCK